MAGGVGIQDERTRELEGELEATIALLRRRNTRRSSSSEEQDQNSKDKVGIGLEKGMQKLSLGDEFEKSGSEPLGLFDTSGISPPPSVLTQIGLGSGGVAAVEEADEQTEMEKEVSLRDGSSQDASFVSATESRVSEGEEGEVIGGAERGS